MMILGLESSCDETACGIVKNGREVLASIIASQVKVHAPFGGVVPEIAARSHLANISETVQAALDEAKVSIDEIDAIATTQGPGLIGALLVAVSYTKGLAAIKQLPLIPVNHVHAHIHGGILGVDIDPQDLYPCLSLVVSGGHTNLYYMSGPTHFRLLANSIDDACGECFDKVAKLLGFPYPGGPHIERVAKLGSAAGFEMPVMVKEKKRLEFSYSGLKTAVLNLIKNQSAEWKAAHLADLCAAFQDEALGQVVRKMKAAISLNPNVKHVIVAGGVAANMKFREMMAAEISQKSWFPPLIYCSDNGAMIAAMGFYNFQEQPDKEFFNWSNPWDAYSRYDFEAQRHV